MMRTVVKSSLSPSRQRFLQLLQEVQFGRIENLVLRDGEPLLEMRPRVVRTITFAGAGAQRAATQSNDFELKRQMIEMLRQFDDIGSGVIARIDIKSGLPCYMSLEDPRPLERSTRPVAADGRKAQ